MESVLASAVGALERGPARQFEHANAVKTILLAPEIDPAVLRVAGRLRPASIYTRSAGGTSLKAGEVLITEFRIDGRSAQVTLLVGPGREASPDSIEQLEFKKEPTGQWVLAVREAIRF